MISNDSLFPLIISRGSGSDSLSIRRSRTLSLRLLRGLRTAQGRVTRRAAHEVGQRASSSDIRLWSSSGKCSIRSAMRAANLSRLNSGRAALIGISLFTQKAGFWLVWLLGFCVVGASKVISGLVWLLLFYVLATSKVT